MTFKVYDSVAEYAKRISLESAVLAVACFENGCDPLSAKHKIKGLSFKDIQSIYSDIEQIEASVIRAMKGENKQSIVGENIIYNTVPDSLDELKRQVCEVCIRDMNKSKAVYTETETAELEAKISYVIDRVVICSKSDKTGTFEFYKQQFE